MVVRWPLLNGAALRAVAALVASGVSACEDDAGVNVVGDAVGDAQAGTPFDAVHAIFVAKCTPCHSESEDEGAHRIGDVDATVAWETSQLAAYTPECEGLTKGACGLVRVQLGQMPMFGGCTGDPVADEGKPECLTAAEQAVIQRWIDDGQRGPAP